MALYQAIRTAFIPESAGSPRGEQVWIGSIADFAAAPTGAHAEVYRTHPVRPYNQSDFEVVGGAGKAVLTVQGAGRYPLALEIHPNDPAAPGTVTPFTATADGQTKDIPYAAAGTYMPLIVTPDGQRETFTVTVTGAAPAPTPPAPAPARSRPAAFPDGGAA